MADLPIRPDPIDRTTVDFGQTIAENIVYLRESVRYHQELLDTVASPVGGGLTP